MRRAAYGYQYDGTLIVAPRGWRILPEGEWVPHVHRYCVGDADPRYDGVWGRPLRCHSTMTPITARVWGRYQAYAVPDPHVAL